MGWILQSRMIYLTKKLKISICLIFKPLHCKIFRLYVKEISFCYINVQNIELLIYLYYHSISSDICFIDEIFILWVNLEIQK